MPGRSRGREQDLSLLQLTVLADIPVLLNERPSVGFAGLCGSWFCLFKKKKCVSDAVAGLVMRGAPQRHNNIILSFRFWSRKTRPVDAQSFLRLTVPTHSCRYFTGASGSNMKPTHRKSRESTSPTVIHAPYRAQYL